MTMRTRDNYYTDPFDGTEVDLVKDGGEYVRIRRCHGPGPQEVSITYQTFRAIVRAFAGRFAMEDSEFAAMAAEMKKSMTPAEEQ